MHQGCCYRQKKTTLRPRRKHWELFLQLPNSIDSSIQTEVEVKNTLCNTVSELPVTLGEIKEKTFDDDFIKEI